MPGSRRDPPPEFRPSRRLRTIYREIINVGILKGDRSLVIALALLLPALAAVDALLGLLQTFLSARIGSRMVLNMRVH